jgi:hypothetical protein
MYRIIGADGREYGPISRETLLQWIGEGRANAQSWVQAEGAGGWQVLSTMAEFVAAFGGAAPGAEKPWGTAPATIAPMTLPRRTNNLATASLVMGLLAITCGCCCCYGFPFNLLGVVFGAIALTQISRAPEQESGRELAIAGLVLSLLSIVLSLFLSLFSMVAAWPDLVREMRRW